MSTSAFIDLASMSHLEQFLYGGADAVTYFVRATKMATWFSQIPVQLSKTNPQWGSTFEATINRSADYLLNVWLTLELPALDATTTDHQLVRWVDNVGHRMIRSASIKFNDMEAEKFDGHFLNFWTAFTLPESKRVGYDNMIGNVAPLNVPHYKQSAYQLNVPLPFFFTRHSGVALPTAALPYNEMKIHIQLEDIKNLVITTKYTIPTAAAASSSADHSKASFWVDQTDVDTSMVLAQPKSNTTDVWANYAVVSNDERKRMACSPRDILIEQVQESSSLVWQPNAETTLEHALHYGHSIKAIFFGVHNTTHGKQGSNYTTRTPLVNGEGDIQKSGLNNQADPIISVSMQYENANRLKTMAAQYFSLVQPYYHAPSIPTKTGMHMYSYALDVASTQPCGSTNFGKLHRVALNYSASDHAKTCNGADDTWVDEFGRASTKSTHEVIVRGVNHNIIRISGGALGFPIL